MENKKTEKKRIFSKLTVCVAALALVSCAFVGGTFARYTSQGEVDNGGANVADWYIDVMNGSGVATASLTISPDDTAYVEGTDRTHTASSGGTILTFVNRGEVSADVTVNVKEGLVFNYKKAVKTPILDENNQATGEYTFSWEEGTLEESKTYTDSDGNAYTWDATNLKPVFANNEALNALWNGIKLGAATVTGDEKVILKVGSLAVTGATKNGDTFTFTLAPGERATVTMGEVTWTSDFDGDGKDVADARDTWIGENIAEVGYAISWSAEQSSEQPEPKPAPAP